MELSNCKAEIQETVRSLCSFFYSLILRSKRHSLSRVSALLRGEIMKLATLVTHLLLLMAIFTAATADSGSSAPDCKVDADCQPSSCCHATHCVAAHAQKDSCENTMCSAHCLPFTLDCGGTCKCTNGKCGAILRQGIPPVGGPTHAPPPNKLRRTIIVRVPARR